MRKIGIVIGIICLSIGFLYRVGKEEMYYNPYDRRQA